MICPNKNLKEWEDLKAAIKSKRPNLSDNDVEHYAYVAFNRHGDIPSPEVGIDIIFKGEKNVVKKDIKQSFLDIKAGVKKGLEEGKLVGAIEQGKDMSKEINKLKKDLEDNKITQAEYKERIKELEYEGRFKEAEGKLAGEIEGKKAGRKEGRAEEKSFQKEFAARVSVYLDELTGKGKIDNVQAQTIARRAAKVGTSEAGYKRFTDYVDKVVENADYANQIEDVKKLQEAAKRIKSALSSEVNVFTNVNPEDIPSSMLTKYKQALDLLTGKVQNPSLMKELTFEIQKIKADSVKEKDFQNVTSMKDAEKAFKSIYENKLESIEDYKKIISDTNKLKRKLNELKENGDITEEDYDSIGDTIALDQKKFEEKYKEQIDTIKDNFIKDIKGNKIETNYNVTPEEQGLINDINGIKEEDLKQLPVEDLYMLNEALGVANDGYIDVSKLNDVVTSVDALYAKSVADELNGRKEIKKSKTELAKKLLLVDDVYWESELGLPAYKVGPLYLEVIDPFRKGVADYVNDKKAIQKDIYDITTKKYKLKSEDTNKMGMIVHYLQEYYSQFNPELKDIEDIGKRDEFNVKLNNSIYTDNVKDENTLKLMKDIYESLPKGKDGKVNPEDVYNDFINNGTKYLTDNQRNAINDVWKLFDDKVTNKQEYANNLRDKSLERIPAYMPRSYYNPEDLPEASASVSIGLYGKGLKISSDFGKERISKDILAKDNLLPKTDFLYLMNKAANSAMRDYHITKTLKDLNKRLNVIYENIEPKNKKLLDVTVSRMKQGITKEIKGNESDAGSEFSDKLLSATSVQVLVSPIRTFFAELPSGLVSYPLRSGTGLKAYGEIFKSPELADEIKNFTRSPIRIKENINSRFDLDTQKIILDPKLNRAASWLSGFTEAHLNTMIWMPKFRDAFKDITNQNFDAVKFRTDPNYKIRFKRELNNAGAVADQSTQEIIGPTTTASAKLAVDNIFTRAFSKKPLETTSGWGKVVGYMGGYNFRDNVSFFKGFKEMTDMFKDGYGARSLSSLSKPLGVLTGVVAYGYLSGAKYYLNSYLKSLVTGNNQEKEYAKKQLESKFNFNGAMQELGANVVQVAAGRYGTEGRIAVQAMMTAAYYASKDKETKAAIDNFTQNVTFQKIAKLTTKSGKDVSSLTKDKELSYQIVKNIASASEALTTLTDAAGGAEAAAQLVEDFRNNNVKADKKELALALKTTLTAAQVFLLTKGLAVPEQKRLQSTLDAIIHPRKESSGDIKVKGMSTKAISEKRMK